MHHPRVFPQKTKGLIVAPVGTMRFLSLPQAERLRKGGSSFGAAVLGTVAGIATIRGNAPAVQWVDGYRLSACTGQGGQVSADG